MRSPTEMRVSRRVVMKGSLAAGVGIALASSPALWAAGDAQLPLITKTIPSTGEKIPVIGVGTNAYGVTAPEEIAARREVLLHLPQLGGKIVDTARGYGESEVVIGQLLAALGNRDRIFVATKTPNRGDVSQGTAVLDESFRRLQTDRIDLLQVHNFHGLNELLPAYREYKQARKIRYIGVSTSTDEQYPQLIEALQKQPLDFIQVDYSIENRGAADKVLPLAQEKGVAVLINVPLGGRRGNILPKVANRPLPQWAAEFDVTSWAQLLLKYNVSHPAVTAVIPGTTKLSHLKDNQQAGRGKLLDAAARTRLEQFWESV